MRFWMALVVCLSVSVARADSPPASPRIAALSAQLAAKHRGAEDAFWKRLASEGTPLVEDVKDPKGRLLVTFVFRARGNVKHVAMYGAPNGAPAGYARLARIPRSNVFAYSALVDPRARFTYRFAPGDDFGAPTDGEDFPKRARLWRADLLNKTPYTQLASLVELPKAPPQPWLVPKRETKTGELVVHLAKSKALGNERPVVVYTPPGFRQRGPRYPLVVMFDGPAAVNLLGLPIVLDELIAAKRIPPVVVLLVGNADRDKELPGNAAFADFVAHDLVPWVRRTYHTTSDRRRTVIAGISYGGIAATFAASRHPAIYGNVLSQSGSYWWSADDASEPEVYPRDFATRPRLPLRFWLECGVLEAGSPKSNTSQLGANRHFRDVLVARGYDVTYREFAGAHEYINWRGSIADALVALLAKPPRLAGKVLASPGKAGGLDIDAGRKSILHLAQRLGLLDGGAATVIRLKQLGAALTGEGDVNSAGYALLELGRARDAIPLFEWNVERFPKSSNAYDSLGEAYYHAGDRKRALASYRRSLELDPKNENAKLLIELLR